MRTGSLLPLWFLSRAIGKTNARENAANDGDSYCHLYPNITAFPFGVAKLRPPSIAAVGLHKEISKLTFLQENGERSAGGSGEETGRLFFSAKRAWKILF